MHTHTHIHIRIHTQVGYFKEEHVELIKRGTRHPLLQSDKKPRAMLCMQQDPLCMQPDPGGVARDCGRTQNLSAAPSPQRVPVPPGPLAVAGRLLQCCGVPRALGSAR